uniref:type II RES/Xre toxin-antitoxin system antitoxin n=1 Tax=Flectobacillus sp. TaxID=50419 RepID=UPI003B9C2F75
ISNKYVITMEKSSIKTGRFDPKLSIKRAREQKKVTFGSTLVTPTHTYTWSSSMERLNILRKGIPYEAIEVLSQRINTSVKDILQLIDMPQTTYNKKKREQALLTGRDSEIVLLTIELLDYGIEVFNQEEDKFQRWLKKSNIALGGVTPESLLDSTTGIQEVMNCLNRLEYGNLA